MKTLLILKKMKFVRNITRYSQIGKRHEVIIDKPYMIYISGESIRAGNVVKLVKVS